MTDEGNKKQTHPVLKDPHDQTWAFCHVELEIKLRTGLGIYFSFQKFIQNKSFKTQESQ